MQKSSFSTTKNVFIAGTLFLTLAGVATRIIGFFYRIFLSRLIGAEGLGIYQLLSPVTALGFAVTAAGIQTSISKFVSTEIGKKNPAAARHYLAVGLLISLFLSTITGLFIWLFADFMADSLLGDTRCTPLLRVLSFSFVPACIHACINGYYYGLKKTAVPSLCQLSEQLARVGSVYVMYHICIEKGQPFSLSMTIWGLVIGEIASTLVSITFYTFGLPYGRRKQGKSDSLQNAYVRNLLGMAVPLTANRIVLNLFASVENIMIPNRLCAFGYTTSEALSVYGILTGMSMSVVMFPSVITNSVSVLLLPTISEAQAIGDTGLIRRTITRTIRICLLLGFTCTTGFFFSGKLLGNLLFENALSGTFIATLGWICPFLYLSSTLTSVLHGLGYPGMTFFLNLLACAIRILFVLLAIPVYGIKSYLIGMLVSQIAVAVCAFWILQKKL